MPYVYILKSKKDDRYYIGSCIDLNKRLDHHKKGWTATTKRFGNIQMVFSQKYNTLSEARKIERKLKKLKRKDYLEKIISDKIIHMRP